MLPLLLLGCSVGLLRTEDGQEPLRSAWFSAAEEAPTLLLLSNSSLLCELPESDDPAEIEAELTRQEAGLTREGAQALYLELEATQGDLVGDYAIEPEVDDVGVRELRASWWTVKEAEVEAREGIVVSYTPGDALGDLEYVPAVPGPGSVAITQEEERLEGSFDLSALDLSGRFSAAPCARDSDLFSALGF